jgi:class 3 adenylate cyclase/DNA-binding CsgD family transcriptional regulator
MAAVVTLLFTDLVGSTELLERLGDDAAETLRRTHFRILREAVSAAGGQEVKNLGDGLMVVFESALSALDCAVAIQRGVERHNHSRPARPLEVRVGLHVGEPIREEDDYFGTPVVVAKRLCDAAPGGQILASDLVRGLVGSRGRVAFESVGPLQLKGLAEPLVAHEVRWKPSPALPAPSAMPAAPPLVPLVGREVEFDALEAELARAAAGRLRTVLVVGEAGIGKTRLAAELLTRHSGEVVGLSARAYPLGATASLGLWVEALEGYLRGLDPREVAELCGPAAPDLAALLPTVAAAGVVPPARDPPRVRLLGGLANLLARLADEALVVITLDDVHLADGSSWEALNYLARNLADRRILLILAGRPVELADSDVATQALLGLEQEGYLVRRHLQPLGADDVRQLAAAFTGEQEVSDTLVEWLMERSRGTPLFAAGLLRALTDEGADLSRPELRALPEDLTERVAVRLGQLDPASRSLLEMVAVVGSRVTFGELVSLSGHPLDRLADLLQALVRSRIVSEFEHGSDLTYEMGHPLYQEAVYQSIGGARRRALHRHVARALVAADRPGPAAAHFVRSADPGDPEAVDALRDALAQAEARELHREALALLEALLGLLPAGDRRWLDVYDAMARQPEWIVDHRTDVEIEIGLEAMRRIDQLLAGSADPCRRAAVKLNLAVFLGWGPGDVEGAIGLAEESRQLFGQAGDTRAELLAANEIGYLHWIAGDMRSFEAIASEVLDRAEALGDRFVMLQGLCALAHNRQLSGDLAGSVPVLDRAIALAREEGKLYRTSYLLAQSAFSLGLLGRAAESRARLAEGRAANPAFRATVLLDYEMNLDWLHGELTACVDAFHEQLAWTGGHSRRRALGSCVAAISAAELGDGALARSIVDEAMAVLSGPGRQLQSDQMRWARGVVAGLHGDATAAIEELTDAIRRQLDGGWGAGPFTRSMVADLAEISALAGDAPAAAVVDEFLDGLDLRGAGDPLAGVTLLARGGAALARGAHGDALEALDTAAPELARAGWPLLQGRILALIGRAAAANGDRDRALHAWRQASDLFGSCGAVVRRGRTLEDLGRLGARGRRASAAVSGPAALTRREREVVRLAATGHSAKDIAKLLFIGERTVESHLARAYAKLGVNSRVDLVRLAPDLDL